LVYVIDLILLIRNSRKSFRYKFSFAFAIKENFLYLDTVHAAPAWCQKQREICSLKKRRYTWNYLNHRLYFLL